MSIDATRLMETARPFPMIAECFSSYITWICQKAIDELDDLDDYGLLAALEDNDTETLAAFEKQLDLSRSILRLDPPSFADSFGFRHDLLVKDPEKIHDLLAEPFFAIDLHRHGFKNITRIAPIEDDTGFQPTADLHAERDGDRFAVETKTFRVEKPMEEDSFESEGIGPTSVAVNNLEYKLASIGDSAQPYWWKKAFRRKAVAKIKDSNKRVLAQLENTAQLFDCRWKLLALRTRLVGASVFLSQAEWVHELRILARWCPEIDYFCVKANDRGPRDVIFVPPLALTL